MLLLAKFLAAMPMLYLKIYCLFSDTNNTGAWSYTVALILANIHSYENYFNFHLKSGFLQNFYTMKIWSYT